ncbi:N-acetylmuramoyl-L-alanine amidase family protein [Cohnella lupini]|uniref:N-acetylmuramoyl-L-alanine amidase n=1 Tax=Cohnella lupini TaxID=1294267 RepID=A0A3D9IC39_9BACL|nr:N-acetylmuramoyl-L-alanine amidase [Cohnella lupini]RED59215.1 N-acetylmuramoyl-L-alanine amidase [Cohnella lupini]
MSNRGKRNRSSKSAVLLFFLLVLGGAFLFIQSGNRIDGAPSKEEASTETPVKQEAEDVKLSSDKVFKIVIDPGHGGNDPGAPGYSGIEEKADMLAIGLKVYDLLQQEPMFEARLTRNDDTFVELGDRAAIANDWGADALISIHGNSYTDESIFGTEVYYEKENSLQLAETIHSKMLEKTGLVDRGVRNEQLKVLSESEMPAVLMETGYLSNPDEEAFIQSEDGQARIAQAIVDGLKQYFQDRQ